MEHEINQVNETNSSIYTPEELAIFKRTTAVRLKIVDNMTKEDTVPDKVGEVRVLNELLNSLDKGAHDAANNRLKFQDSKNTEAVLETVTAVLRLSSTAKAKYVRPEEALAISDYYTIEADLVEGEIEIDPAQLDIATFTEE